jgi:MFS family permease
VAFAAGFFIFLVDFKLYMLVRAIQGFCAGSFSALVPLIIKETAPFELSGLFGVFHQLFITIGIFTCCILTYILSLVHKDDTGKTFWHLIFGFPLIIITLQTICLNTLFRYETPKYLIDHNQEDEARQIIERIYFP